MPGQHALLSPSSAHRWLKCTAAPRLESAFPDKGSSYAQEGTLAHALCAKKLKSFLGLSTADEDKEIGMLQNIYLTGEMVEYTDTYKTIVLEKFNASRIITKDAQLLVETRLDFSEYVPEAFGTADAIIIADGLMDVIDFKYGKGVKVSAIDNAQMMIYALGAYLEYSFEYRIDRVRMTIIQPRLDNLSEFEITVNGLKEWADKELRPKAEEAFNGTGKQNPGDWCQFCKVKHSCKALADKCLDIVKGNPQPELISSEEIAAGILPWLPIVKQWLTGMEDYTLQQALSGVSYPGYKLVEGRSVRKIADDKAIIGILAKEGYGDSDYMKPRELKGLGDLERLVGKKRFAALCSDYLIKPPGKPTLVTIDDKRPALDSASEDFNNINL